MSRSLKNEGTGDEGIRIDAVTFASWSYWRRARAWVASRRFWLTLMAAAVVLLSSRLDNTAFWIDESMNGLLGENILRFGYPKIWDGVYLVEPYFNAELTDHLVRISHTWLQFYLTAASLAFFGNSALAARLPSIILGILCLPAIYNLARRISGNEWLARVAALLLTFNVGFLLYSRLARYFSLSFLLSILLVSSYLRWSEKPTKKNLTLFTLCSVLLFYAHFPIWPFLLFSIVVYFLVFDARKSPRRLAQFTLSSAVTIALVLPWLLYAKPFQHSIRDWSGSGYLLRLEVFTWKINTWVFPFFALVAILGAVILLVRLKVIKAPVRSLKLRREYFLLLSIPLYVLTIILAHHPMISSQYTAPTIPFAMIVAAYILLRIREHNRWLAAGTLALLLSTNLLQTLPFVAVDKLGIDPQRAEKVIVNPRAQFNLGTPLEHYLTEQLSIRSYLFEYLYFITHPYQHRLKAVIRLLQEEGSTDQVVLAPWHDADAIRFYTNMKVVYHFKPSFSIETVKTLVYQPNVRPDWIIPNAYYEPDQPFFKFDRDDYERVYIRCPKDYIYENEPNLDFFMWRTNRNAPEGFYLLKRKRP